MKSIQATVLIALFLSLLPIGICDLIEPAFALGPNETMINETGEVFTVPPYGEPGKDFESMQFIARLKDGYLTLPKNQTEANLSECEVDYDLFCILENNAVYYVKRVFPSAQPHDTLRIVDGSTIKVPDLSQTYLFLQSEPNAELHAVNELEEFKGAIYAEPNQFGNFSSTPNDSNWIAQWNLKNANYGIGCETAWEGTVSNPSIKVAVIDGGINYNHSEMGGPGYPNLKVVGGYDYFSNDSDPMDDYGFHGTAVAGIIGELTNNNNGDAGIAGGWHANINDVGASLYALKIGDAQNNIGSEVVRSNAILAAADPNIFGCKILNSSWDSYGYSETIREAVHFAYKTGASFVASKHNGGINAKSYPADFDYDWVTCVAGYGGNNGQLCIGGNCTYSSDFGFGLDILAPGNNISVLVRYGFVYLSGNSFAAPHVAGSIALIRSLMPNLHNEDTDWILKFSALDLHDNNVWTWNELYGHGDLKISTVIRRIGHPKYQPYDFLTHDVQGGESVGHGTILDFEFLGSPLNGTYTVDQYDVRLNVTYPEDFGVKPFVWVVGDSTLGWSSSNHNYQDGWGQVILNTATRTGCQMQTFVYEVFDSNHNSLGWFPCRPEEVSLHYRLWGTQSASQPNRGGSKLVADLPQDEALYCSAYPNPFNQSSQINLTLRKASRVSVDIYDILGRKIRQLLNLELPSGIHNIVWDGKNNSGDNCSSGVYYCMVSAETKTSTLKLVLIK